MKARNAIVALVVGAKLTTIHREWFLPAWRAYGGRHGIDIVVIERALDDSPRAASRSPAWQKLLAHAAPEARVYERLAWVDADVLIRPDAPDIFGAVPRGKVGAVDDFATPTREDHTLVMKELYRRWDHEGIRYASNRTAREYYANYGISCDFSSVVQTGVMVFEPALHGGIFEKVYRDYEEGASPSLNHEMRPLSFELLKAGVVHWIDPKFNMQWSYYRELHYPFLDRHDWVPLGRWLGRGAQARLLRHGVNTAYRNNYFLHFAGGSRDYAQIDDIPIKGVRQGPSAT